MAGKVLRLWEGQWGAGRPARLRERLPAPGPVCLPFGDRPPGRLPGEGRRYSLPVQKILCTYFRREGKGGRKGGRDTATSRTCPDWGHAGSLGVRPDRRGGGPRPFPWRWDDAQPAKPHRWGLTVLLLRCRPDAHRRDTGSPRGPGAPAGVAAAAASKGAVDTSELAGCRRARSGCCSAWHGGHWPPAAPQVQTPVSCAGNPSSRWRRRWPRFQCSVVISVSSGACVRAAHRLASGRVAWPPRRSRREGLAST